VVDEAPSKPIETELLGLPSDLRLLRLYVEPGNHVGVERANANVVEGEDTGRRVSVNECGLPGSGTYEVAFPKNVGFTPWDRPLGDEFWSIGVTEDVEVQVTVLDPGMPVTEYDDGDTSIVASSYTVPLTVQMELGASVSLHAGGRVTAFSNLQDEVPLASFDSARSLSSLLARTTGRDRQGSRTNLALTVEGTVDSPPQVFRHDRVNTEGLKVLTNGAFSEPALFLLIGPSASGKTTLAEHMARQLHDMGRRSQRFTEFPILLEMARSGDERFHLHEDREGFELLDPSAYQDALRVLVDEMRKEFAKSVVPPDLIVELAPDGFWAETLTIPPELLDAAHVLHVETNFDDCIDRLTARSALPGADNHGFDANVWRQLFAHDNSGFTIQLAQARAKNEPMVAVFYNGTGSHLVAAARQFAEYGVATSTTAAFRRLLGPSGDRLIVPGEARTASVPHGQSLHGLVTRRKTELIAAVADTRLLKRQDVKVYGEAAIDYQTVDPQNINFSTFYLQKSQLMGLCRVYTELYELGIDPFDMSGYISYECNGQQFNLVPIVVERTQETVVGDGGITTTAESLTAADGAHTLYLARLIGEPIGVVVVSGVNIPFYAIPNIGDLAIPGDTVPANKKLYRVPASEASAFYRDFGPFRTTGLRTVGEGHASDFDTGFESALEGLRVARLDHLHAFPTGLGRALA
jgi:energy-coupling factor transporter ATP-binding protein EcfA2